MSLLFCSYRMPCIKCSMMTSYVCAWHRLCIHFPKKKKKEKCKETKRIHSEPANRLICHTCRLVFVWVCEKSGTMLSIRMCSCKFTDVGLSLSLSTHNNSIDREYFNTPKCFDFHFIDEQWTPVLPHYLYVYFY